MRNKKVHITIIAIFIAIISVSLYYILTEPIKLGLDLKGGTQIILKPTERGGEVTSEKLKIAMDTIRKRIDRLGMSEPLVTKDLLSNNIVVQLPGEKDPERAKEIVGKTAQLEFRLVTGTFISIKDQNWDIVKFDYEKGQLIIDPDAEEVILIDDINALLNSKPINIIARLVEDPDTGELLLVEPDEESNLEENSEDGDAEESSGADTGINIDPEKVIGKIIYNSETRELLLVSGENEEEVGEILV
ncbi:unnamed protein product, partial [marine sediment metagenome]